MRCLRTDCHFDYNPITVDVHDVHLGASCRRSTASLYPNITRRLAVVVRWHQDRIKRLFNICKALTRRTIPCVWACVYLGCDSWQTDNRRAWYSLRHQLAQLMRDQRRKAEAYHIVARMAHLATDLAWHFDGNMGHVARLIGGEMIAEHRDADRSHTTVFCSNRVPRDGTVDGGSQAWRTCGCGWRR